MDILEVFVNKLSTTNKKYKNLNLQSILEDLEENINEYEINPYHDANDYINILKNRDYRTGFAGRILYSYSEAFYLLEIFSEKCLSILMCFREKNIAKMHDNNLFLSLLRLLGRSILIAGEIITLLKNGFPSGALGRWRTLFETSIFSMLIVNKGDLLAKQYLDYIDIENYNEAKIYAEHCEFLEIEKNKINLPKLEKRKFELEKLYGKNFSKRNGWTINFIKLENGKLPSIKEILIELKQINMYPYYQFSNIPVHAGPKNLFFDLAKINGNIDDKIVSGPSNIGFTEPAQLTALSLYNAVGSLLSVKPKKEYILELILLRRQIKEIGKKFMKIQERIEKEEKKAKD